VLLELPLVIELKNVITLDLKMVVSTRPASTTLNPVDNFHSRHDANVIQARPRVSALSWEISQDDKNHREHLSRPSNLYPKLAAVQKQNSGQALLNTIRR
jgi:hypothetical protein